MCCTQSRVQHATYRHAYIQVISRAVYKFVLLKVTTKVMQGHVADTDATFLVGENGQIQRLVQDYIKHCQLRGIDQ